MDINNSKNQLKHSTSAAGGGGEGDKGFVIFGPLEIKREALIEDLFWLHSLTRADDFQTAISLGWHKVEDKIGREKMSKIVNLSRISQDGKSRPPFNFEKEYGKISGPEAAPALTMRP